MRSSTVYVEGDASIGTYQDGEGKTRSSLNIVQRTYPDKKNSPRLRQVVTYTDTRIGTLEVVKRPNTETSQQ